MSSFTFQFCFLWGTQNRWFLHFFWSRLLQWQDALVLLSSVPHQKISQQMQPEGNSPVCLQCQNLELDALSVCRCCLKQTERFCWHTKLEVTIYTHILRQIKYKPSKPKPLLPLPHPSEEKYKISLFLVTIYTGLYPLSFHLLPTYQRSRLHMRDLNKMPYGLAHVAQCFSTLIYNLFMALKSKNHLPNITTAFMCGAFPVCKRSLR